MKSGKDSAAELLNEKWDGDSMEYAYICSFNYPLDPPLQVGQYFLGVPLPIQ